MNLPKSSNIWILQKIVNIFHIENITHFFKPFNSTNKTFTFHLISRAEIAPPYPNIVYTSSLTMYEVNIEHKMIHLEKTHQVAIIKSKYDIFDLVSNGIVTVFFIYCMSFKNIYMAQLSISIVPKSNPQCQEQALQYHDNDGCLPVPCVCVSEVSNNKLPTTCVSVSYNRWLPMHSVLWPLRHSVLRWTILAFVYEHMNEALSNKLVYHHSNSFL